MIKKTLVIDARMINQSGVGTYIKNLVPKITYFFDITLLVKSSDFLDYDWIKRCKIIHFNANIYSLKEQLLFPFKIPKSDLLWSPHFNSPILPIRANRRVTTIHDVNHLALEKNKIKKLYASILYRNSIRRSSELITVSVFSKDELIKHTNVNFKKINIIHCGVSTTFLNPIIAKKNLPKKYILFVGNVKPHKNLISLLKAYKNLKDEIKKEYKLVILGKNKGFITPDNFVYKYIKNNKLDNDVIFTGYIEDNEVPNIYKNASLFVFPSLYEGFGLPLLEAMQMEVPILSSYYASLKEIGGDAVMYFNPKDTTELSQKITEILLDSILQKELIKKGKKRLTNFSWDTSIKKHIEVFNNILNI